VLPDGVTSVRKEFFANNSGILTNTPSIITGTSQLCYVFLFLLQAFALFRTVSFVMDQFELCHLVECFLYNRLVLIFALILKYSLTFFYHEAKFG